LPSGIAERRVVLVLDAATLLSDQPGDREHVTINMILQAGELALIHVEPLQRASTFADICSGLLSPVYGHVSFLNQDWAGLPSDLANTLRGRIGRVFATSIWLPHLSLLDNVVLRQLHHTQRPIAELCHEAVQLATRFGLPGLPAGGPRDCIPSDLQRAACVSAFLGSPVLLLLEEPTNGVYPELLVPLIHAIRWARSRGSAVVWLTAAAAIWHDPSIPATWRYRLIGRQFMEMSRSV
jgi:phospholipid/cholesterol/gamma-HCH transport system ATP-binding protein